MRHRESVAPLAIAFLATLLWISALRSFFAGVYFHSLAALSIDVTAAATLVLLAPALLGLARRWPARPDRAWVVVLAAASALALPVWLWSPVAPAAVAVGAYLLWLPLRLKRVGSTPATIGPLAAGFTLAWAADAALAGACACDWQAGWGGLWLAVPAAAELVWLGVREGAVPDSPHAGGTRGGDGHGAVALAGAGLGGWLVLAFVFIGSPGHVANWNGVSPAGATIAIAGGLAVGAWMAARPLGGAWPTRVLAAGCVLLVAAAIDHAFVHSPLAWLLAGVACMALAAAAPRLLAAAGSHTSAWVAVGVVLLILPFAFVLSFTYAYVPGGAAFKGLEPWIVLAAAALAVAGWVAASGQGVPAGPGPGGAPAARIAAATDGRWLGGAVLAVVGVAVVASAWPGAAIDEPAPSELLVVSYNIHQGFNNDGRLDLDLFERILRDLDADIVALQESDTARITSGNVDAVRFLADRLGYHAVVGPPTREQSFGTALLSRLSVRSWSYEAMPSDSDNRLLTTVVLDAWGTDVTVFPVHFGLPFGDRHNQTTFLLDRAGRVDGPVIVAGDLNSCPEGLCADRSAPVDTVYTRVSALLQDAMEARGFAPRGGILTYPSADPNVRIDYVFASSHWRVGPAHVLNTPAARSASDHLPVVALLELTGSS